MPEMESMEIRSPVSFRTADDDSTVRDLQQEADIEEDGNDETSTLATTKTTDWTLEQADLQNDTIWDSGPQRSKRTRDQNTCPTMRTIRPNDIGHKFFYVNHRQTICALPIWSVKTTMCSAQCGSTEEPNCADDQQTHPLQLSQNFEICSDDAPGRSSTTSPKVTTTCR